MSARLRETSSFRDAPLGADPESRDSGFAAARRPGMTAKGSSQATSIRLGQAQHLLRNKTENELRADRGDARDQGFAQVTLDVIFLGVTEAAMGHHRLLAGVEARFRREIFGRIGGGPAPPGPGGFAPPRER